MRQWRPAFRIYSGSCRKRAAAIVVRLTKQASFLAPFALRLRGCWGRLGELVALRLGRARRNTARPTGTRTEGCSLQRKKNLNMPTTGPPACVDLLNFCHHTNTSLNQTSHLSTSSPPHHAHQPLLSPLASADSRIPSRRICNHHHPVSIRQTQWPEARASHLEGRAPAVRRAPRDPRSNRATLPELVFR